MYSLKTSGYYSSLKPGTRVIIQYPGNFYEGMLGIVTAELPACGPDQNQRRYSVALDDSPSPGNDIVFGCWEVQVYEEPQSGLNVSSVPK